MHGSLASVLMGLMVALLSVQPAQAVVSAWKSAPSTADWSDSGNWDTTPQNGDSLVFASNTNGTTTLNNNLTAGAEWTIPSITFTSTASAYTISGNAFNLGNGTTASTVISNASTNTQVIKNNISLSNAAQTISTVAGGGNVTLSGNISGAGTNSGVVKTGAGSLTLSGSNTYNGATVVNGGTLVVSGSLAATSSGSVAAGSVLNVDGVMNGLAAITSAGTVQGQGSVGKLNISAGGTLAPGKTVNNSEIGALTANGDVTFANSTSTFSIRVGQTTSDKLIIAGENTLTLNNVTLSLDLTNYTQQAGGLAYVIVSGGARLTGVGSNVFAQGLVYTSDNGDVFNIYYASNADGTGLGDNIVLRSVSASDTLEYLAVPEPSTWAMIVGGVGMLLGAQRMRRARFAR